jgi:hypothetical protein
MRSSNSVNIVQGAQTAQAVATETLVSTRSVAALAGAAGVGTIAWLVNWWFTDKYSKKEIAHLKKINEIYSDNISADRKSPILQLREGEDIPVHKFTEDKLEQIAGLNENRIGNENFLVIPDLIIGTIEDYIVERNQRFFASGKAGDVLSIVLLELRNWARDDLTQMDYTEETLKLLIKRKAYVAELIKNGGFDKGFFGKRKITKFDTFKKIESFLDDCITACKEEQSKQTVRDHLRKCRKHSVSILKNCLSIFYLFIDKQANKVTFKAKNYLGCNENRSSDSRMELEINRKISTTENGRILKDIILLTGLDAPANPAPRDVHRISRYYNNERNSNKRIKWESNVVTYPWNNENSNISIQKFQDLGQHFLHFYKICEELEYWYKAIRESDDDSFSERGVTKFLDAIEKLKSIKANLVFQFKDYYESHENKKRSTEGDVKKESDQWSANFERMSKKIDKIEIVIKSSFHRNQNGDEINSIEQAAADALRFPVTTTSHVFCTSHSEFFDKYNAVLNNTVISSHKKDIPSLALQVDLLKEMFKEILSTIENEKPQWRFKYFIIPESLGWPFHGEKRYFTETFTKELKNRFELTMRFINSRKDSIVTDLRTSAGIKYQMDQEAKRRTERIELYTSLLHKLPKPADVEQKEEVVGPTQQPLDKWFSETRKLFTDWQDKDYSTSFECFIDINTTEMKLTEFLKYIDDANPTQQENIIGSAFFMRCILTDVCLKDPIMRYAENRKNLNQVTLLEKFLHVIVDSKSEDFSKRKSEFETECKKAFGYGYSSHGLMRSNRSSAAIPDLARQRRYGLS